jgi:outer membrane protein OmpA-like peptidoglycan-associated protein
VTVCQLQAPVRPAAERAVHTEPVRPRPNFSTRPTTSLAPVQALASPLPPDAPVPGGIAVRAEVVRGGVLLTGIVPEDARSELVTDIAVVVPPNRITDRLRTAPMDHPAGRRLAACAAVVRTLAVAASSGSVSLAGDRMEVIGAAVTAASRPTLEAAVALARSTGLLVVARLTGTRPAPGVFLGLALDSLRFEPGRCDLSGTACQMLDQVAAELTARPGLRVRIDGHADPLAEAGDPGALSTRRADVTTAYLARRGVPRERMSVRSFGGTRPVLAGRADPYNRRIEITVVEA